jgi:predicted metal-dependent hydrolase
MFDSRFIDGLTQFTDGHYFDAHETWEALWITLPNGPTPQQRNERLFVQACIQLAVALHHHDQGNPTGARNLLAKAGQKLERLCAQDRYAFMQPDWHRAIATIETEDNDT